MLNELKAYIRELYLHQKIDADRYRKLLKVSNDLQDARSRSEGYEILLELATTKGYSEFKRFLTQSRLRAAEQMEGMFLEKVDGLIDRGEIEKAGLMLEMVGRMY